MKTKSNIPSIPQSHTLFQCIGINPAGIYCKVTSLPLSLSSTKSLKAHIRESHPNIPSFRLENHFLNRLQESLIDLARQVPNRAIYYKNPESSIEKKWFCSNCNICFWDKCTCVRHIERHEHCSMDDIRKEKCYQLMCKRYFPISGDTSSQMYFQHLVLPANPRECQRRRPFAHGL